MKRKITFLSAAFMLLAFLVVPLGMRGQTMVASFVRNGNSNEITGGEFSTTFSAKNGYYQDNTGDCYMQILNTDAYWTTTPASISFDATIGGGSGNKDLSNPVYVALLDGNGEVIDGTQTEVTSHITTNTGDDYTISIPATNNVYGVKLSHEKESGYNVRYFSFSLSYVEGSGTQTETHTLTFSANPTEGGTVTVGSSTSGSIALEEGAEVNITATPAEVGYAFSNWTVSGTGASVDDDEDPTTTFTMGTEDATLTANFTTVATYTVTYHANVTGIDDVVDTYNEGATVTLRGADTFSNEGYTFEEWNTDANGDGDSYEAGYQIEGIDEDIELYAIWTENTTPTPGGEVVDVLNRDFIGVTGTSYSDWSGKTGTSGAVYAGNSAGGNNSIQLRSNNNNSGIVTTTSGGKVTKVVVKWNSNTASDRTLNVYGKNSAYSAASDLYNNNAGTSIGTIVCGTSTELNITDDYEFIGVRSASGAMYLDKIEITWTSGDNPAVATTTVINVPEGFNTDIYQGTEAGTLTATVSAGETTLEAATVTWTSSNEAVATIDENGHVTLVAVGTTTITASYVGEEGVYRPSTATYQLTVVNTDPDVPGTLNNPYTVAQARAAIDAGAGVNGVYATGIVSAIVTDYNSQYGNITFDIVDAVGNEAYLRAYRCGGDEAANVTVGDVAVVYGNLTYYNNSIYEFAQGCEVVSLTHPVVPSITVNPATVSVDAEETEGTLDITYENLTITGASDFDIQYYNAQGEEIEELDWISAEVNEKLLSKNDTTYTYYEVTYIIAANNGEARTAYFKVSCGETYSNLVTVTQAAPVLDYAVLPFVWAGGSSADFAALNGVTLSGNGSDYNSNHAPYLIKFDGTGDYIQVKTNGQPGLVTIGVKMIGGGNTSTITIQGSADGETFTDIEELTISGAQNDTLTLETTNAFDANDRYVRMLFTKGSNVGVGPITIAQGTAPSINIAPANFDLEAVGDLNGMQVASGFVTYNNIDITQDSDFHIQFYNAEGVEQNQPEWILGAAVSQIANSYQVACMVGPNTGAARSTYYKVYAFDADSNPVYSNLVTINQAGVPQPSITVTPDVVNVDAEGGEGTLNVTYTNITEILAEVYFCDANGEAATYDWIVAEINAENNIDYLIDANEGEARIAYLKVYALDDNAEDVYSNLVTINQEAYVAPVTGTTYTLVTSIQNGRRYIITNGSDKAMGGQNNNNRAAVDITIEGNVAYVNNEDVAEFVINNYNEVSNVFSIYDANVPGYLYAASSSSNYLRTETLLDANHNGAWTVSIASNGAATVKAEHGNNSRNLMRYNSGSNIFSCYGSGQQPVYFYMKDEEEPEYTFLKDIKGYNGNDGGYYLIASPIIEDVNPANVPGMTENNYDLYWFDQTQELEWRNYETESFNLVPGKGYLYANNDDITLAFTGTQAISTNVSLTYDANAEFAGWNLVGNPMNGRAYINRDYYDINEEGTEIIAGDRYEVLPMQGIFVIAEEDGETMTFIPTQDGDVVWPIWPKIVMNIGRNSSIIDRTIVRFGEGRQLPKFQLNENSTKVYIPQGAEDFAVVRSANEGEMPVNFRAAENGTYTFSVNADNVDVEYLHLIDNMTGTDVDLLATPSYTFEANTTDYASRFRLVFSTNAGVEEVGSTSFAYYNGSQWVVSNMGEATLQVVDVMGRVLSTETINGNAEISLNQVPGVYMIRLVNGNDVKVQKVVVK